MTTIITRTSKGSALTNSEYDANLNNLNNNKVEDDGAIRPTVRPTFSVDFAKTKVLSPKINFTRASTGTFYDGKSTAVAEQNLLSYSQEFDNLAWTRAFSASISPNTVISPDGTTTADTVSCPAQYSGLAQSINLISGLTYTISVWVMAATGTNTYHFAAGTNIQSYTPTSSWQRFSFTFTATSTGSVNVYPVIDRNTSGFGSVYLWGAQLEQRSTVTSYTPTTSSAITNYIPVLQTAAVNTPRFDVDPVTGESKGLLIESSATNLLTYSSDYSNAAWDKTGCSITYNAATSPDGTLTANLIVSSSSVFPIHNYSFTSGVTYTLSVYAKAYARTSFSLRAQGAVVGQDQLCSFNLVNATYTWVTSQRQSGASATIVPVGNGWYRCSITFTSTGTVGGYIGTQSSTGIYIWGAQLEVGSFATSYIPTTSAQVTRAADSAVITDTSWLNPSEGTFFFNKKTLATKANQTLFSLDNGTTDIESRVALIPNSRNLLTYTEQFDNAPWTKARASIVSNTVVAPDYTVTGDRLVEDATINSHVVYRNFGSLSGTYTFSVYAKASERSFLALETDTVNTKTYFNLSTGTVVSTGSIVTSSIIPAGNGWFRCSISGSFTGSGYITIAQSGSVSVYAGDGTSGIYIWGAQLELGSTASPYEPNPLYLSTFEVGSDGYALSDNNTWNDLAAYAYASNDISASQNNNPYASVNIQSSTSGTKAIINKTSGTVDFKNCNIKDMSMGGGATFTASKTNNSYDQGNNFGITFQ